MRRALSSAVITSAALLACTEIALAAARAQAPAPTPAPKPASTPITLNGCVSDARGASGQYTFDDSETGTTYRLTGKSARKFAGKRVELVGGPGRRLSIRGGLLPSPNTAAQAGALDPAKAAIANFPGGASDSPGGFELPEFRVTRVRALEGSCK